MLRITVFIFAISLLFFNCSLMGLSDLDLMDCKPPGDGKTDPCLALNKERDPSSCLRYQCSPDGKGCVLTAKDVDYDGAIDSKCEKYAAGSPKLDCDDNNPKRFPDNPEVCDGIDNDCNLVIDENSAIDDKKTPATLVLSAPVQDQNILYNSSGAGQVALTHVASEPEDDRTVSYTLLSGDEASEARAFTVDRICVTELDLKAVPPVRQHGCHFDEVATTTKVADKMRIAAAVNVDGCSKGQLRVGYIDDDDQPQFKASEPVQAFEPTKVGYPSNTYFGIDVDLISGVQNSGASHLDSPGAARLKIAALEPDQQDPQALLVWLGDAIDRLACGSSGQSVLVQALGLWLDSDAGGKKWVQASDEGKPRTLGRTKGGGRPALAVWPGTPPNLGYFIGYGDENGQVALHFVPPLGDLPEYRLPDYRAEGKIPSLSLAPAYRFSDNRSKADHVVIVPANETDDIIRDICGPGQTGLELGVAWQENCGSDEGAIFFTVIGFITATETFCFQHEIIEIVRGSAKDGLLIPTVGYVGDRFVVPGFERNSKTATEKRTGGWVIAWAEKGDNGRPKISARRVAEFDVQRLDKGLGKEEIITLSSGFSGGSNNPILYPPKPGGKGLYFAFAQSGTEPGFVGGSLLACEAK